jgi:hypothetical protein
MRSDPEARTRETKQSFEADWLLFDAVEAAARLTMSDVECLTRVIHIYEAHLA